MVSKQEMKSCKCLKIIRITRKRPQRTPNKLFKESCQRSKQRHVKPFVSIKSGKRTTAQVVKLAIQSSPNRLKKMKLVHDTSSSAVIRPYSPEESLAKNRGANIYPSYHVIAEAKRKCYPANNKITEDEVVGPLLDLNVSENCNTIKVYYKWSLDGSGGHNIYKQNFANNLEYANSNIILCTIVPLEMCESNDTNTKINWKNTTPSSTSTKEIKFKHIPICTMLDGKTINVLTDTLSSQACNVLCDEDTLKFGISILHAHLRCYEYLLHITYKLELQQWQARGENAKEKVKERKSKIATFFYKEMSLVLDQPKQGGGNSNNGNTAQFFLKNLSLVSQITEIDKALKERFANIFSIISCGHYVKKNNSRSIVL
ncbi:hypothetical protein RN001_004952 [Aquatica leii]|uniref:Uncharacterized protein n=1 Tax=Aquatica leii TaxID=1421715 RepID=A0AAN7PC85_9COLE|nr:hypothetical protein RN001_004952 [Aquatica leii]